MTVSGDSTPKVCLMKAVLDTGAGLSTISVGLAQQLQNTNPTIPVVESMQQEHKLRVADGREVLVTQKTCPLTVSLHT